MRVNTKKGILERDRQTERQREGETDRQTEWQTADRHTHTDRQRQTERQTGGLTNKHTKEQMRTYPHKKYPRTLKYNKKDTRVWVLFIIRLYEKSGKNEL